MKPVESVIILPSLERFVNPALAFIRGAAASCGFSGSALNDIEVAAEEALTNVIKHAFEGSADETFKLSVRFTDTDFMITVFEKGMPFSPDRVPDFDPVKLENTLNTDGLGVYLMKKTMDDVIFENLGRDGKSLTLVKHIKDAHIKRIMENDGSGAGNAGGAQELSGAAHAPSVAVNEVLVKSPHAHATENVAFDIRLFRPEDALEISRCAYKSYGYTYEPYIYYPEKIIEMNGEGKLRSFIAAGRDGGEILGHIAFKYKNAGERIAEIGVAFVRPEYRKSGIYKAMMNFSHEKALELKLLGLYGRAVTSHIGSQKILEPMGYVACGVFLGLFPDDVDFKSITGKIRQKESGLLFYRPILEEKERAIYVPARHENKISEIFKSCNISVKLGEGISKPGAAQSRINVNMVPVLNIADVEVNFIGADIIHELKSTLHNLRQKHIDAVFLHVGIEDPCASFVAEQCELMGFFFSGVLPYGQNGKHEFILQYMNNLEIDYDAIKPYSQRALEILNYVRSFGAGDAD